MAMLFFILYIIDNHITKRINSYAMILPKIAFLFLQSVRSLTPYVNDNTVFCHTQCSGFRASGVSDSYTINGYLNKLHWGPKAKTWKLNFLKISIELPKKENSAKYN
jgi:hypothetical protein